MELNQAVAWEREGRSWPHRDASRFVQSGGLRWLVQQMGDGPVALLLHGTGSSTHSWRGVMPALARTFTVVAMDLPGHAFTDGARHRDLSLEAMAGAVGALVDTLGVEVAMVVGHSAGAAIGAQLALQRRVQPRLLVAINGAFFPLPGLAGVVFPPVARLMAATPWASRLFARRNWDTPAVERLIHGTGSSLDAQGVALYGRLLRDPEHAAGALGMMSQWDLHALDRALRELRTPLCLIVGGRDRVISPAEASRLCRLIPASTPREVQTLPDAGHLVHEEQPDWVARRIECAWDGLFSRDADAQIAPNGQHAGGRGAAEPRRTTPEGEWHEG
jgi:magnesium chelatase accessory protein